jgi:circadian clock protein KaiB
LAVARLRKICEELVPGNYEIEVIDVSKRPDLAKSHQVAITSAILRNLSAPLRTSIVNFSNKEKALLGLGLFDFDHLRLG